MSCEHCSPGVAAGLGDTSHSDATEHFARTVAIAHELGIAQKPRPQPRPSYPMMEETELGNRFAALVQRAHAFYAPLLHEMPKLIVRVHGYVSDEIAESLHGLDMMPRGFDVRNDAGEVAAARSMLDAARARWLQWVSESELETLAAYYGNRVSIAQRKDLARQIRSALGVDVPLSDTVAGPLISDFAHAAAVRVGSIPGILHGDIASLTMRALNKRMSPATFAELIEKRFGVTENNARFIARDQLAKLNGKINQSRQATLGISHYFWITMRDDRVRPVHRGRLEKRYAWDGPPQGGHPGEDWGCRCSAMPDLSPVIAMIKKMRALPQRKRIAANPLGL